MPRKKTPTRRGFGSIKLEKSRRYTAFYTDPDGRTKISANGRATPVRHYASKTFETKVDAEGWLTDERRLISTGAWTSPAERKQAKLLVEASKAPTFGQYASTWIDTRKNKSGKALAPRTRDHYKQLLADYLEPAFGHLPLDEIAPAAVNAWYDDFAAGRFATRKKVTGDTTKAHTYSLARAVMNTATSAHGPLVGKVNPFAVRGGGTSPVRKRTQVATSEQFKIMLATIRPQWQLILLLGCWTGLRYSEIAELRRSDIDLKAGFIHVSRSVTRSKQGVGVKAPKSDAGIRDQIIPTHVQPALKEHLRTYVTGKDGLLFPGTNGQHLAPVTFYGKVPTKAAETQEQQSKQRARNGWYAARAAAGCPTLRFHDLRATGATLLAQQGGTVADVQVFLGDSTPQAALRYVRSADGRQKFLADRMAALDGTAW